MKKGYKVCLDETAEDKTCSNKYKTDLNVLDHTSYYGLDFPGVIVACQWSQYIFDFNLIILTKIVII